jgi:uncharacterized protein (TIGR02145 family)
MNMEKSTFTDPRDGKTYKTVKIGEQVWMAENLNYEGEGSVCYGNHPKNAKKYGRFYDRETAKKACPKGWHLPSDEEWSTLVDFAGGKKIAGEKLKAKKGWKSYKRKSGNGTDEFGFAALPGGYGFSDGNFNDVGYDGYWWSATEYNAYDAYYRYMYFGGEDALYYDGSKDYLYSVRCVRD